MTPSRIASEGADLALVDLGSAGRVECPGLPDLDEEDLAETKRWCEEQAPWR